MNQQLQVHGSAGGWPGRLRAALLSERASTLTAVMAGVFTLGGSILGLLDIRLPAPALASALAVVGVAIGLYASRDPKAR